MRLKIALLILGVTALASACSGSDKDSFRNVDHDKNGRVSYEELLFVFPDMRPDIFSHLDTNGDGGLSQDEYAAFLRQEAAKNAEAARKPSSAPATSPADAPADEGRSAVPYKGEEVIEIPAPGSDQKTARSRQDAVRTPAREAKPKAEPAPRTGTTQYTVLRGDNLTRIAHHFGVSVEDIVKANGNMNPDTLRDGQVLNIPPRP